MIALQPSSALASRAPEPDAVAGDANLPPRVDVVVIGGGIIGTATAFHLARRGVAVALCEKGMIAGEQSGRNWGWVRKARRDPRELPLIVESLREWAGLNEAVGAETGFRASGIAFAAESEAEAAGHEAWLEHARPYQIDARMIRGSELDRVAPGMAGRWRAALHCPSDGRAEPQIAAPAIARAAQASGAAMLTRCAVRGIERKGGRVAGVVTERGRIRCDMVVVAGGAWSRRILQDLDVTLPQLKLRASVLRTAPLPGGPDGALWCEGAAFRKRLDGGYTIANGNANTVPIVPDSLRFASAFLPAFRAEWRNLRLRLDHRFATEWREARRLPFDQPSVFEGVRVLDPDPDIAPLDAALRRLSELFPIFREAVVIQRWAGMIDATPDAIPVISTVDGVPGLVIGTGFSGHGFGIGPAAGRLMADLATGAAPLVDPHPFRLGRFSDGSRPRPLTGI